MRLSSRARACALAVTLASPAFAQTQPPIPAATQPVATQPAAPPATQPTTAETAAPESPTALERVIVSPLDIARSQIAPSLGATTYTIGPMQIQNIPGGESAPFQQVLLRAPGVVPDSFGGEHVRGEHANLTYRVNGVLLPQPLESFAQELDTRLVSSATLITGSLPAQFGFHTAGVVDVITKTGATLQHNELSLYGGSFDTFKPSFQTGGTVGKLDYFVTGTYIHNDLGLENPTASYRAPHDYTDQQKLFGYFNYTIDQSSRLTVMINTANADFQIPNTPGLPTLAGDFSANSANINENQNQQEYYTVIAYQKSIDRLTMQLSVFSRYADINFRPDPVNDLIFTGVAGTVFNGFLTNGIQYDASYLLTDNHTLRGGLIADYTCEKLATSTAVFDTDPQTGDIASTTPRSIEDDTGNNALETGVYLQDEWRITPKLTLNYGLRYDRFDANFDHDGQLSPRINMVFKPDDDTTMHLGYSRYFVPPPVQNVSISTLVKFTDTTNAPENFLADAPKPERSHYFDAGISRQVTKQWQIGVDGFYKHARNLIDLGQFGAPVILAPFNYRVGNVYGAELSTTYTDGGLSLFGNFSWVRATASGPNSQQFLWANDELAFAETHNVILDHESEFTISSGASYAWKNDRIYIDSIFTSGLRRGFANTQKMQAYYPVNIGYEHTFHFDNDPKKALRFRVDVVNVFDEKYQIRDGSGVGVGASQFGERLGFFGGITYEF